nr:MAG TPA: hypothetical protein [Bacteriophage sp.]
MPTNNLPHSDGLCRLSAILHQPQTNTVSNKQATHSFPHGGELYRLSLPRV